MSFTTSDQRSKIMRSVKSNKNKSTELLFISLLKESNITGWRRNFPLFGKPDFTFPKEKIVVFVDGCFWHGHNCRNTKPKTNKEYWKNKRKRNKKRDNEVNKRLKLDGWKVIRIWECELKNQEKTKYIKALIMKNKSNNEINHERCFFPRFISFLATKLHRPIGR